MEKQSKHGRVKERIVLAILVCKLLNAAWQLKPMLIELFNMAFNYINDFGPDSMTSTVSWINRFEVKPGRWVYNPTPRSRETGCQILNLLNNSWKKPSYYYHLRDGGHVKALKVHIYNSFFAKIDIKDFFGAISRTRITRALKSVVDYPTARRIAKISTVKTESNYLHSHHLPYGFIQSPILASICLFDSSLGRFLEELTRDNRLIVSIYVDDIIISSNDQVFLSHIYELTLDKLSRSHFIMNSDKSSNATTSVSAFNIQLSHKSLILEKARFEELRIKYLTTDSEYVREGIKSYINSVNPAQVQQLI